MSRSKNNVYLKANFIIHLLKRLNMPRKEFADRLCISHSSISSYLTRRVGVSELVRKGIMEIFSDNTFDELFEIIDEDESDLKPVLHEVCNRLITEKD